MPAKKKTSYVPPPKQTKKVVKTLQPLKHNGTVYGVGEVVTDTKNLNIGHLVKEKVIKITEG